MIHPKEDKPEYGKQYRLTGGPDDKAISNGHSWSESLVKPETKKKHIAKKMQAGKAIKGQCENCGSDFEMKHSMKGEPKCPHCGKHTQNWDTVHGSTMAPSIKRITK